MIDRNGKEIEVGMRVVVIDGNFLSKQTTYGYVVDVDDGDGHITVEDMDCKTYDFPGDSLKIIDE